jgi:uncharacterized membrane protein SpoIIM required for sporulation
MSTPQDNLPDQRPAQVERLEELLGRASTSLRSLTDAELLEFGRLYRRAAAALSHSRSHGFAASETARLNAVVGRAYALLYVSEPTGLRGVKRFFRSELPRTVRRHGRLVGLCAAVFLLFALAGAGLAGLRPDLLASLDPAAADAIDQIAQRHEGGQIWLDEAFRPIASSFIMANNIQVSFLAFSTGILLGLGTLFVLAYNGLVLGMIAGGVSTSPASVHFWSFVAPHGIIELPAIILSGAAGLLLGFAIVDPGEHSRLDALRLAGRQAAIIMLVSLCLGGLFLTYLLAAGRAGEGPDTQGRELSATAAPAP